MAARDKVKTLDSGYLGVVSVVGREDDCIVTVHSDTRDLGLTVRLALSWALAVALLKEEVVATVGSYLDYASERVGQHTTAGSDHNRLGNIEPERSRLGQSGAGSSRGVDPDEPVGGDHRLARGIQREVLHTPDRPRHDRLPAGVDVYADELAPVTAVRDEKVAAAGLRHGDWKAKSCRAAAAGGNPVRREHGLPPRGGIDFEYGGSPEQPRRAGQEQAAVRRNRHALRLQNRGTAREQRDLVVREQPPATGPQV